jgi:hypothetical protein
MTNSTITVDATLQPDGRTIQLAEKLALAPGRVTVTVQSTAAKSGPTMVEVLERIHREQRQRGRKPMTEEEMAAEMAARQAEDEEYEERWRQIWSDKGKPEKP